MISSMTYIAKVIMGRTVLQVSIMPVQECPKGIILYQSHIIFFYQLLLTKMSQIQQYNNFRKPSIMIQTIIEIENNLYPFQQSASKMHLVNVEDIQIFSSLKSLLQKKSQMQKKIKLIDSPYLIKLHKIYQEDLNLHYIYEYVPYSLPSYIQKHQKSDKVETNDKNCKTFLKKISSQLTMLISYLVNMRIEVDLSTQNLGFTQDEKLKLYMNARCKMGHKTEVSLIAYYKSCKQKIIDFIEKQFEEIKHKEEGPPNFVIKGNKLVFAQAPLNESLYQSSSFQTESQNSYMNNSCESGIFNQSLFANGNNMNQSTSSCINQNTPRPSFLRQTQGPQFGRSFNFSQSRNTNRSSNKAKTHKNSFHFGSPQPEKAHSSYINDNQDAKSFTHSRSIRIQLEQKLDPKQKKQRKDSYKVKITSFNQYEMDDCNPQDIFPKNPQANEDLFEHFAKQAKKFEKKQSARQESAKQDPDDDLYEEMSQPGPFRKKQSMPDYGCSATQVSSVKHLEEKVRIAKQKATNILNHYMKAKKMSSYGQ